MAEITPAGQAVKIQEGLFKIPVYRWHRAVALAPVPTLTKALCWALECYMNGDASRGVFPSVQSLAKVTGMDERSVQRHIKVARDVGLLETKFRHNDKGHRIGLIFYARFRRSREEQTRRRAPSLCR